MRFTFKRIIQFLIAITIFFSSFGSIAFSNEEYIKTDIENLEFKQEIKIPIDTSLYESKYQPIDLRIIFEKSCWAQNDIKHSVRVGFDDGSGLNEIESQIYDLEHSDEYHITTCSIVFLIPESANGKEKYYVLYDDSETSEPGYIDHVSFEDTHYFYEPISGQKIDFDYYKILQGEYSVYGIIQKGEILENGASQSIVRNKPNQTEFETTTIDQLAGFYLSYSQDGKLEWGGSAWATTVSKTVLVDGNLMIRFRIECVSPDGVVKTDNIYTYYYCPISVKRISINCFHEVLKTTEIKGDKQRDPTYSSLSTFKARSATIEKLNIGDILPSLHFYSIDENIKEYSIPSDPNTENQEWILSATDNADVGSKAWLSMDDPSTGKTHGLIFESNAGFIEGKEDGLEVKSSTKQHVKLPGLEADTGDVFATRNSVEGGKHDTSLTKGMKVTFNNEFITFQTEGYEAVNNESEIYKELVSIRPINRENDSIDEEEIEKYTLTAYVHLAPSIPLGSMLSALSGKNFSYVSAELYKDNSFSSSGSIGRISLANMDLDFDNKNLIQIVSMVIGLFDWRNVSFFKKISFPGLEAGRYIIKIYKENPLIKKERQYIGFTIVDLNNDLSKHIYCRPEGEIQASIKTQENKKVENVLFSLLNNDAVIEESTSDKNGNVILKAPRYPRIPYTLIVMYQGFLVEEKTVVFGLSRRSSKIRESFDLSLNKLTINVKDTLGLPPAVDINPMITSSEMVDQISINAEKINVGKYQFTNLFPAEYIIKLSYKSFILEKIIDIKKDEILSLEFPAEFNVEFNLMNSHGFLLGDGEIVLKRSNKKYNVEINNNGKAKVTIPPGEYELLVSNNNKHIANQNIDVKAEKSLTIVTTEESSLHIIITYLGVALAIFSIFLLLWKKNLYLSLNLLTISLIIIALVSPWWFLSGETNNVSTNTKTLLIPSKIITLTSSQSIIGGEISFAPPELSMVLDLLAMMLITVCLFLIIRIFIKNRLIKINKILLVICIILLVMNIILFYVTMSQVTDVGVGCFSGSGDLDISIPGIQENAVIICGWGPGIGFYLGILATICLISYPLTGIYKKIQTKIR